MNTIVPLAQLISTATDEKKKKKTENSVSMIDWPETFLDTSQALRFGKAGTSAGFCKLTFYKYRTHI